MYLTGEMIMNVLKRKTFNSLSSHKRLHHKGLAAISSGILSACLPLILVALPNAAHANASGVQSWGSFCLNGKCFPKGGLWHDIYGSGLRIDKEVGQFVAASPVCNWRIDFRYYTVSGYNYKTSIGPTNYRCNGTGHRTIYPKAYYRSGRACAILYSNSTRLATQCHSLHP
jgi:hypothetical protein